MRLYAFDNIRIACIFLVVLFHTLSAFSSYGEWWYLKIYDSSARYNAFMGFADIVVFALLFFTAGFVAAQCHRHDHSTEYLRNKFTRLLIPGYLALWFVCPLLFFFAGSDFSVYALIQIYVDSWHSLFQFNFDSIKPSKMGFHHHIWFIEVLFIVSSLFFLTRKWTNRFLLAKDTRYWAIAGKLFLVLSIGWLLTCLAFTLGYGVHDWLNLGGVLVAQPARLGSFISAYALGLYFSGLYQVLALKRLVVASIFGLLIYFLFFQFTILELEAWLPENIILNVTIAYTRIMACFIALLSLTFLFLKFFNQPYRWLKPLYPLSYGIYLLHLVFVVALLRFIIPTELNTNQKVVLVTFGAFGLSATITYFKQRIDKSARLT